MTLEYPWRYRQLFSLAEHHLGHKSSFSVFVRILIGFSIPVLVKCSCYPVDRRLSYYFNCCYYPITTLFSIVFLPYFSILFLPYFLSYFYPIFYPIFTLFFNLISTLFFNPYFLSYSYPIFYPISTLFSSPSVCNTQKYRNTIYTIPCYEGIMGREYRRTGNRIWEPNMRKAVFFLPYHHELKFQKYFREK